jgi:hypothetical protein
MVMTITSVSRLPLTNVDIKITSIFFLSLTPTKKKPTYICMSLIVWSYEHVLSIWFQDKNMNELFNIVVCNLYYWTRYLVCLSNQNLPKHITPQHTCGTIRKHKHWVGLHQGGFIIFKPIVHQGDYVLVKL